VKARKKKERVRVLQESKNQERRGEGNEREGYIILYEPLHKEKLNG